MFPLANLFSPTVMIFILVGLAGFMGLVVWGIVRAAIDMSSRQQEKEWRGAPVADQLRSLAELHAHGQLSDKEFAEAKAQVLRQNQA